MDIFDLKAVAREHDLRNRVIEPERPNIPALMGWACLCGNLSYPASEDHTPEVVCDRCGSYASADGVPLRPRSCPSCHSILPNHGRGCYLDPAQPHGFHRGSTASS